MNTKTLPVPNEINTAENLAVLDYLTNQSAHSDTAEVFCDLVRNKTNAQIFVPNGREFSYGLAYANSKVFGFCVGMQNIWLKIPENKIEDIIKDGGFLEGGRLPNWVSLPAFGTTKRETLQKWVLLAYEATK